MSSEQSKPESLPIPDAVSAVGAAAPGAPPRDTVPPPEFSLVAESDRAILGMLDPPRLAGTQAALGAWDVVRIIGMGGMGVVVLARSPRQEKPVAIKLLRTELMHEPRAVQRFLVEARHMSKLSHPNILPVLEVAERPGATPYYVMPYLGSGSVAHLTAAGPLDEATTLRIASQVASAIAHAHEQGIIHRDLKPGNILLDDRGDAHVSDFGLVRTVFNDTLLEPGKGHCEGSAAYMSPAVAAGVAEDTRCDIYSFGATMYEMLTGHPPYEGRSSDVILAKVRAGSPPPVLSLNPGASERLARVCEGAMARELRDRYARMQDVIVDLQRISRGEEPLGPRGTAPGRRQRARPVLFGSVAMMLIIVGFAWWALSRGIIVHIKKPGEPSPFAVAPAPTPAPRIERIVTPGPHPQAVYMPAQLVRGTQMGAEIFALRFTPDGQWLYAAHREAPAAMALLDAKTMDLKFTIKEPAFGYPIDISDDSRLLISPNADGSAIIDTVSGTVVRRLPKTTSQGTSAISPDGKYVANWVMEPQPLRHVLSVYETESGKLVGTLDFPADQGASHLRFLDGDRMLAATGIHGILHIFNWRTGQILHKIPAHGSWFNAFALSRDRKLALTGGQEGPVHLWDLETGQLKLRMLGHGNDVSGVGFLPDGNILSADAGGYVFAWDAADGHELWRMRTPMSMIRMDVAPDGSAFAIGTSEGHIYLFTLPARDPSQWPAPAALAQPADAEEESGRYLHHRHIVRCVAVAPDGRRAVSGDAAGMIVCFELHTGEVLWSVQRHNAPVYRVQFMRDGAEVLSSSGDGTVRITDASDGSEKSQVYASHASCITSADSSGSAVAVGAHADTLRIVDPQTGQTRWSIPNNSFSFDLAFSPDGSVLAHCRNRFAVFVHEAGTGKEITKLLGHESFVSSCCFVNDSNTIISGCVDGMARVWDIPSGTVLRALKHDGGVSGVAVSPDGRLLATAGGDFLKLWDLRSGSLLRSFTSSKDCVVVQFTPDGQTLLTAGPGPVVRSWHIPASP